MKVTPKNKRFGKYEVGTVFEFPDKIAAALIKAGKLEAAPTYPTKVMKAEESSADTAAPKKRTYQRRDMQAEK